MIGEVDIAYIAGLFDGEGSINIRRAMEKKKKHKGKPGYRMSNSMRISMEITMTDRSVLIWVHEVLGVGTLRPKTVKGLRKDGTPYLPQYKWRCTFRDAYHVCCLDTEKNRFDKLQQEQRDLDASYRQSLKNKKEREEQEDNEEYLKQLKDKL
jgi:hypothetical protein